MIDNKNDKTPSHTNGKLLLEILNRACEDAAEMYREMDPDDSRPLLTGIRKGIHNLLMPLKSVHTEQADPAEVELIRAIVRSQGCDCLILFYPVEINRPDGSDEDPIYAVVVEVQFPGLPGVRRMVRLDAPNQSSGQPVPKLPVIGKAFGVFYPRLLSEGQAA